MTIDIETYLAVTATTATDLPFNVINLQELKEAIKSPQSNVIKLMLQTSALAILNNREYAKLLAKYNDTKKLYDNLLLALNEIKNTALPKNLTPEATAKYQQSIAELTVELDNTKDLLTSLISQMDEIKTKNQFLINKSKHHTQENMLSLKETTSQQVEAVLTYLKKMNFGIAEEKAREELTKLLDHSALQAQFIAMAGPQPKGFLQKLKGLFKNA